MVGLRNTLSSVIVLLASTASAVDTEVDLGYATYIGTALPGGISQWLGIRYAAPPLGELRFMPPQDPLEEDEPQMADKVRCPLLLLLLLLLSKSSLAG